MSIVLFFVSVSIEKQNAVVRTKHNGLVYAFVNVLRTSSKVIKKNNNVKILLYKD